MAVLSGQTCVALYPYVGEPGHKALSFAPGDAIRVRSTTREGWWEGEKEGQRGWFPASYVQLLEGGDPATEEVDSNLPPGWKSVPSPSGQIYYVNTQTNETTWENPSSTALQSSLLGSSPSTPIIAKVNGFHSSSEKKSLRKSNSNLQASPPASPTKKKAKAATTTINDVTFPSAEGTAEQSLLKPDEWSYCDHFWTDRQQGHSKKVVSGFNVLVAKQMKGQQMTREMAAFFHERIRIEEEYARNLSKLSKSLLVANEEGTLAEAWAQIKKGLSAETEVHLKFASKVGSEVEKPLLSYRENFHKEMKKKENHVANFRKQLADRRTAVEKARKGLAKRQKELEMREKQNGLKPSNKAEVDIMKSRMRSTQAGDDLMKCMDLYNQAQFRWFEEMVTSSLELERLEADRVEKVKEQMFCYAQLRRETDMFNQSTLEPIDQALQKVEPGRDRELWVRESKTGHLRPVDMDL
uniref:growth arrest-specific protein 7-like isoform X2 n=1 Tax=Myxine glutinosa TaxID=7769 RepID=UPI00358EDECE